MSTRFNRGSGVGDNTDGGVSLRAYLLLDSGAALKEIEFSRRRRVIFLRRSNNFVVFLEPTIIVRWFGFSKKIRTNIRGFKFGRFF